MAIAVKRTDHCDPLPVHAVGESSRIDLEEGFVTSPPIGPPGVPRG
jgi:hypothetical protein